jgi:hypothetical protein
VVIEKYHSGCMAVSRSLKPSPLALPGKPPRVLVPEYRPMDAILITARSQQKPDRMSIIKTVMLTGVRSSSGVVLVACIGCKESSAVVHYM